MQFQKFPLIAGVITLSLTVTPFAVMAAQESQTPVVVAQAQQQPQQPGQFRLELTTEQRTKIAQIRSNARAQIQQVLTQQQKDQIQTALKAGQTPAQAFNAVQFTPQQQQQLQQIVVSSQQQITSVLTPEQKQQIQKYQESLRNGTPQKNQPQKK